MDEGPCQEEPEGTVRGTSHRESEKIRSLRDGGQRAGTVTHAKTELKVQRLRLGNPTHRGHSVSARLQPLSLQLPSLPRLPSPSLAFSTLAPLLASSLPRPGTPGSPTPISWGRARGPPATQRIFPTLKLGSAKEPLKTTEGETETQKENRPAQGHTESRGRMVCCPHSPEFLNHRQERNLGQRPHRLIPHPH